MSPRWLVVAAWASGGAGLYVLVTLAQAALAERNLTVDVAFGRSLAFWVGAIYLALPLWGFLPARPTGWYARRSAVLANGIVGGLGLAVCAVYGALWLKSHWVTAIGGPVLGSIAVLAAAAVGTLWLAGREAAPAGPPPRPVAGAGAAAEGDAARPADIPPARADERGQG